MKSLIKILFLTSILLIYINASFSQVTVNSNGSLFVDSYDGNWSRANWTQVHYQYTCAYHLANTYYGGDVFYVLGNGNVWTRNGYLIASDSILKTNINNISFSLDKIKKLRGVTYNRKYKVTSSIPTDGELLPSSGHSDMLIEQKIEPTEYGLIAQEVEKIIPDAVKTMHDSTKAISYSALIPILIEAIKEQQTQIETIQEIISTQESKIVELKNCCENKDSILKSGSIISDLVQNNNIKKAVLFQNIPNPFTSDTEIKYSIPNNVKSALIYIHNLNGVEIKTFNIFDNNPGSIIIHGTEL
ncbi:MAG TPA: tail fiber domain-containing protein, partial [Draconibacterium sp.]|nr:tail fiber domain-containing protein [Draconibacterium sp.]